MENVEHILNIENRKRITATAIDSVDAFSKTQIVLSYCAGRIIITGDEMKITGFSKSTGAFSANGTVTGVKYAGKAASIRQKLFR